MLDADHVCLRGGGRGWEQQCLDAVTYCRPGNMSDGAMVYTAVCFYMD